MVFYLFFQWSGAVKNGSMVYFCQNVLNDTTGAAQSLLAILGAIPMAVAAIVVVPLSNKFGKKSMTFIGMAIGVIGGILAGLGGDNMVLVGADIALKCLGSAPACYMILAMLADVIDHIEYKHGIRTDGLTMSIYSSLMVAATPIGGAIKGFARIALVPGETKRVTIPLDDKAFRYFNVKTNRWEIEGGVYQLMLGASSEDIRLTASITIAGTDAPIPYGDETVCYHRAAVHAVPDSAFRALLGHELSPHSWDEKAPLEMNDAIMQLYYAKNPLARWVGKLLSNLIDRNLAKGTPDLNLLFMYNMPFRSIAKMMNGMVPMGMAEDILLMANGHFFKGLGGVIHGFFHRPHLPSTMDS